MGTGGNSMGEFVQPNSDRYSGQFNTKGLKHGVGFYEWISTWTSNGADIYYGEWDNDQLHGQGVLKYTSGDVYEGQFSRDQFHGTGRYIFSDGGVLEGKFSNGNLEGHGLYKMDGQIWEGKFFAQQGAVGLQFHL